MRNNEISLEIWPRIPEDLNLWSLVCQIMSKSFGISDATAWLTPSCIKSPSNYTNCYLQKINCSSWQRRPEYILEIRQRNAFLEVFSNSIIYMLFKNISNSCKKMYRSVVLTTDLCPLLCLIERDRRWVHGERNCIYSFTKNRLSWSS